MNSVRGRVACARLAWIVFTLAFYNCDVIFPDKSQDYRVREKMDIITAEVEAFRQESLNGKVHYQILDAADISKSLPVDDNAYLLAEQGLRFMQQTGWVAKGDSVSSLIELELNNLEQSVLAYYKIGSDSLFFVSRGGQSIKDSILYSLPFQSVVAHELTHALQDDLFPDFSSHMDTMSSDRALANLSLIEGEASLVEFKLFLKKANPQGEINNKFGTFADDFASDFIQEYSEPESFQDYGRWMGGLPYIVGLNFVNHYFYYGGWASIDSLFRSGVRSSIDMLHLKENQLHVYNPVSLGLSEYIDQNTVVDVAGPFNLALPSQGTNEATRYINYMRNWKGDLLVANYHQTKQQYSFAWHIDFQNASYPEMYAMELEKVLLNKMDTYYRPTPVSDTSFNKNGAYFRKVTYPEYESCLVINHTELIWVEDMPGYVQKLQTEPWVLTKQSIQTKVHYRNQFFVPTRKMLDPH